METSFFFKLYYIRYKILISFLLKMNSIISLFKKRNKVTDKNKRKEEIIVKYKELFELCRLKYFDYKFKITWINKKYKNTIVILDKYLYTYNQKIKNLIDIFSKYYKEEDYKTYNEKNWYNYEIYTYDIWKDYIEKQFNEIDKLESIIDLWLAILEDMSND